MKKIAVFVLMLCLVGTTTAFAGHRHGYGGYYERPKHHYYKPSRHHHDGLGIALGVMGGLILGSALANAAPPPPPAVVYERRYYAPPPVCVQDQVVTGEWQYRYNSRVWVEYAYPVTRRVQVPCY